MIYLWIIVLLMFNAGCIFLQLFQLPGNWFMVIAACLFAWWQQGSDVFSISFLIVIVLLAFLGEIIEFFAGLGGARKAGAGFRGSIGALIGAILGAILGSFLLPIPLFGTLVGSCIGAGLGTFTLEFLGGKEKIKAVSFAKGAAIGVLVGTASKIALGCLIWFLIAIAAFWP